MKHSELIEVNWTLPPGEMVEDYIGQEGQIYQVGESVYEYEGRGGIKLVRF